MTYPKDDLSYCHHLTLSSPLSQFLTNQFFTAESLD